MFLMYSNRNIILCFGLNRYMFLAIPWAARRANNWDFVERNPGLLKVAVTERSGWAEVNGLTMPRMYDGPVPFSS